jgi:4-amino-4-deoxy-L-arabinose transferase-like glycosyltransferase
MKFSLNPLATHKVKTWKPQPTTAWVLASLWLLSIAFLAFFWNLGSTGLIDETEPLFAEASRQMTVTGDWITPFFNNVPRFDKPPLIYWSQAIAYLTFGVNSFAARFPSALAGLVLASFCFYTLRYFGSPVKNWRGGDLSQIPVNDPLFGKNHRGTEFAEETIRGNGEIKGVLGSELGSDATTQRRGDFIPELTESASQSAISDRSSRQWSSWLVASLGAAMVALNPLTLFFGRTGYSDMLLSACMSGALLAFFLGYARTEQESEQEDAGTRGRGDAQKEQQFSTSKKDVSRPINSSGWYLAFYVLIGLAVLTKGPVGVVLPALIIGSFLLYVDRAREVLREMRPVRGALIFLALSLPWYILVTLHNGEAYIDAFFGYHNFERFTSVVNHHQGPWYFHILVFLVGFTPWSIALPATIAHIPVFQRRHWQKSPRATHLGLFALFWFLIILGFFTIAATKYFSYSLPVMPAAAILVALWWSDRIVQGQIFHQTNNRLKLTTLLGIVLFLALAGACYYCPHWLGNDASMPNLGLRISQAGLPGIGAAIWGISAIAGIFILIRRQAYWFWFVSFLGFISFLMFVIMPASGIIDLERQLPLRQIADSVVQVEAPGEEVVMIADGFEKPSLVFYTKRHVTFLHKPSEAVSYIQNAKAQSVLVIATQKSLDQTGWQPNHYQEIRQAGIYRLVRVSRVKVL